VEAVLAHVGHVHHRLEGQQEQVLHQCLLVGAESRHARGLAFVQERADFFEHGLPRGRRLVAGLGRALAPVERLVDRIEVGQRQLGIDGLDVGDRIDATRHVHDVAVLEAAHHVRDRVGLADVRQELVAEPLALGRAGDQSRDVDELHRGRDDLQRFGDAGQRLEARVGHRHHAHVRVDGAERVVGRGDARLGQRVEERGLADVRQAHDAAFDAHGVSKLEGFGIGE
jgi:hypothetical protein